MDAASAYLLLPPANGCRLLSSRSLLVAALVFAVIFTIFTTGAVLAGLAACSRPDFGVGRPRLKRLGCCRQPDIHLLTGSEVNRRRRSEFDSIRQVNFNPNLLQGTARGILHRAKKGIAPDVVGQDQPGALSNCIISLGQGQSIARFFAFACTGTFTVLAFLAAAIALVFLPARRTAG